MDRQAVEIVGLRRTDLDSEKDSGGRYYLAENLLPGDSVIARDPVVPIDEVAADPVRCRGVHPVRITRPNLKVVNVFTGKRRHGCPYGARRLSAVGLE